MAKIHVNTTINGAPTEFLCDANQTLLDVLRDNLGLTGSKEGCGSGDCGACSVMVNGRLVCSCLVLGAEAEGRDLSRSPFLAPMTDALLGVERLRSDGGTRARIPVQRMAIQIIAQAFGITTSSLKSML
jgi:xanthine dehydrogenase iron-sulfur cluster and FAD-binding subunit A